MDLIFTSWKALFQYVTYVSELGGHKCLEQKIDMEINVCNMKYFLPRLY